MRLFLLPLLLYSFVAAAAMPDFPRTWSGSDSRAENGILTVKTGSSGNAGKAVMLPLEEVRGRVLTVTAEVRAENLQRPAQSWLGPKLMLNIKNPARTRYEGAQNIGYGTFDWKKVSLRAAVPPDAERVELFLGIQKAEGELAFRNLSIEVEDTASYDLTPAGNMGYIDKMSGNGKGGWSDQGPENDASGFNRRQKFFNGIPFYITNEPGNTIMVFRSPVNFRAGLETAELNGREAEGKYLYLLHSICWGGKRDESAGFIELTGVEGKRQTLEIRNGREVSDWLRPRTLSNGKVVARWKRGDGEQVGIQLSKFRIDPEVGPLSRISFRSADGIPVWIVVGVTVSDRDYPMPDPEPFTVSAGNEFRPLTRPVQPGVRKETALDRSSYFPVEKAGTRGRVIVNRAGHLAFEKEPEQPVFFLSSCEGSDSWNGRGRIAPPQFDTKEKIDRFVAQLRIQGYNMCRLHFLDAYLSESYQGEGMIDPARLDMFFYLVAKLKENGIYINLDSQTSWIGYNRGSRWSSEGRKYPTTKQSMLWDEAVRKNWYEGTRTILTTVNPYTGMKLTDDPVLAIVLGFNEQELARMQEWTPVLRQWRNFLRERYRNDFTALKRSWGKVQEDSFDRLPVFTPGDANLKNAYGTDINLFINQLHLDVTEFYQKSLREMGYHGIFTHWNVGKPLRYAAVRNGLDLVVTNNYHNHPTDYIRSGSSMEQTSSVETSGSPVRLSNSVRLYGRPFGMTEHGHPFWNRYRYEQSFVANAYGMFQDWDLMTYFAQPVTVVEASQLMPFSGFWDPVIYTQEFLAFFMGRRGDIAPAPSTVRIELPEEKLFAKGFSYEHMPNKFTLLTLVTGCALDLSGGPLKEGDIGIPFETLQDTGAILAQLKKEGKLPAGNRSDPARGVFESSTGELYLDATKFFMSINTPRLQGICSIKGGKAELPEFKVKSMSADANLAVVSIDGNKPIAEASRLVMICATEAFNSGMKFEDRTRRTLLEPGGNPTLVQTGQFEVCIRHPRASGVKVYPLHVDGARMAEIPVTVSGDEIAIAFDTAKIPEGPAFFFEIIF